MTREVFRFSFAIKLTTHLATRLMFKRYASLFIILVALPGSANLFAENTVFKTKDANGNIVFSDQGSEHAEEIKVQQPQTFKPQAQPSFSQPNIDDLPPESSFAYESLKILSPEHNSAIRNNAGNVTLQLALNPPLQSNHSIEIVVDGRVVKTQKSASAATLSNLDRGTHQFQARVVEDESGKVLQSSSSVTSTLLRVSIQPRNSN